MPRNIEHGLIRNFETDIVEDANPNDGIYISFVAAYNNRNVFILTR